MAEATDDRTEPDKIVAALKANGYSPALAADALGVSRATMSRRITALGLDAFVEKHNQRVRRRREGWKSGEVSRQARDQAENRRRGLCKCGKPPARRDDGKPGRMCVGCRESAREQKRKRSA